MGKLRIDDDFRSMIEAAVAYRLVEIYKVPAEEARKRVRDFAVYGTNSQHGDQVLRAGYELFSPILSASVPFIRSLLNGAIGIIQAEVVRGQEAEAAVHGEGQEG